MSKVDIFIKSYRKDFNLLNYSLKSISKNVNGYNNIVLLIPVTDKLDFERIQLPIINTRIVVHYIKEYGDGYLLQQAFKIQAHKYSNADYILFSDSDCIFDHEIDLQEYVKDGKPEILYTHYSKVGDAICWKQPTENFIKHPVEFEFMRRNCLIYHRSTLENISNFNPNIEHDIMRSGRFSEFNAIGVFAFINESDKYNFINTDNWQYTEPKSAQLWGWAEKDNPDHNEEYQRSLSIINKTLNLNITQI